MQTKLILRVWLSKNALLNLITKKSSSEKARYVAISLVNKCLRCTVQKHYGTGTADPSYNLVSFPCLPCFYLLFAFTIIHGSKRPVKNCGRPGAFIT